MMPFETCRALGSNKGLVKKLCKI